MLFVLCSLLSWISFSGSMNQLRLLALIDLSLCPLVLYVNSPNSLKIWLVREAAG